MAESSLGPFLGIDGCPGGWILARWDGAEALALSRLARLADAFLGVPEGAIAAVDIPIGLPARAGHGGRRAENAVRPLLGERRSSVFSVPSRSAVHAALAEGYEKGCAVALATSDPPRKISRQAFHLFPKMVEADALLRTRPELRGRLFECHPEVAFMLMNGRASLPLPKKVKRAAWEVDGAGIALRKDLLAEAGVPVDGLTPERARALGAGIDDLVDAAACAVTARRLARGEAERFPDPPDLDGEGLAMAIHA